MEWTEPILFEREYQEDPEGGNLIARLGSPRPSKWENEWECPFQLLGTGHVEICLARGDSALFTLTNAMGTLRRWLDAAYDPASATETHEVDLPRMVPFCYGLDFHRHLCKILDAEIAKKDKEIEERARRRGAA